MKQGEIWLVQFPDGVGHEYKKERPALIVESDSKIKRSSGLTVLPTTSNVSNCLDEDILVARNNHNNLFVDSVIKVHHIQTFDKSRFLKKIGKVKIGVLEDVKEYLKEHFNIS